MEITGSAKLKVTVEVLAPFAISSFDKSKVEAGKEDIGKEKSFNSRYSVVEYLENNGKLTLLKALDLDTGEEISLDDLDDGDSDEAGLDDLDDGDSDEDDGDSDEDDGDSDEDGLDDPYTKEELEEFKNDELKKILSEDFGTKHASGDTKKDLIAKILEAQG